MQTHRMLQSHMCQLQYKVTYPNLNLLGNFAVQESNLLCIQIVLFHLRMNSSVIWTPSGPNYIHVPPVNIMIVLFCLASHNPFLLNHTARYGQLGLGTRLHNDAMFSPVCGRFSSTRCWGWTWYRRRITARYLATFRPYSHCMKVHVNTLVQNHTGTFNDRCCIVSFPDSHTFSFHTFIWVIPCQINTKNTWPSQIRTKLRSYIVSIC